MRAWLLTVLLLAMGAVQASEWPRVIVHLQGDTELTAPPQRVVALDPTVTDHLLALGLPPIGSLTYGLARPDSRDAWPPAIAEQAVEASIARVGTPGNLDLEAIAALEPDLVLASGYVGQSTYNTLTRIAPTVIIESERHFRSDLHQIAVAVGREQEAEAVLERYAKRVAAMRARLGGERVAIVRPRQQSVWMYGPSSNAGRLLTEAGINVKAVPDGASITSDPPGAIGELSLERVSAIDAPHLFVILYNLDHHAGLEGYLQGPMWQRLPAVQQGNVHGVEGIAWTNHGPIGALRMLEEAAAALEGGQP
ncbi:MAG: ABC transporter substrate-binding protein [Halomonas sp.]